MLERALELSGSRPALSHRLRVPIAAIEDWLTGKERIPRPVFLLVVDIILEEPVEREAEPPDRLDGRDEAASS